MGNSYITHYYTGDNCYEFGINSENGKLVGINFQTESFYKKESAAAELRNARERAEEVARECAANFVNLEECGEPTVSVVPYRVIESRDWAGVRNPDLRNMPRYKMKIRLLYRFISLG